MHSNNPVSTIAGILTMASGIKDSCAVKRKLWTEESMSAAVDSILNDNKGLREAARLIVQHTR